CRWRPPPATPGCPAADHSSQQFDNLSKRLNPCLGTGRAMFGFGPGLLPSDAMMLGIDPETQRDRMADAIDIIARLLDGEIITQKSEWYEMREARLHLRPYSKPRPHLAIASAVTPYGGNKVGIALAW